MSPDRAGALALRPMRPEDVAGVERLFELCFANPWSTELIQKELSHPWSTVLVAETQGTAPELLGVGIFWKVHDEWHVLNLATHPDARRLGVGRALMMEALRLAQAQGCASSTLEVRRSNAAAISLYETLGFRKVGVRRNYYVEEREDALLMSLTFAATPEREG